MLHLRPLRAGIALALLAACGESGPSAVVPPANLTNLTGASLVGTAGQPLAQLVVVRVEDAAHSPLPNVTVTFAVTAGGGSVTPATDVTDDRGEAKTRWTLGAVPGANGLTASAGGSAAVQISATGTAGRPAAIVASAGNNQTGTVGTNLPTSPSVTVKDAAGNVVEGVVVTFSIVSGGGRVAVPLTRTNAQGVASAGTWTLGSSVGQQLMSALVGETGVTGNPVVFSATAVGGTPVSVVAVSPLTQAAAAGALVASPPSVQVRDAGGNPVPNVTVTFAVASGGGQLTGPTQVTNAQGTATVTSWRLGTVAGPNSVTATVAGLLPVTFAATGVSGAPASMHIVAGDAQTGPLGQPVPIAPEVVVLDASGVGVPGVTVNFTVGQGGGVVVLGRATTANDGHAAVGAWILGPTPGTNTLVATVTGLPTVTFTATATAGAPASMQAVSLTTQSGVVAQPVGSIPSVVVKDAQGNPVAGVVITFTVTSGGGTITGSPKTTGTNGVATLTTWVLGPTTGANTVVASATGLANVTFTATATGAPAQVVAFAGNNQAAVQGTAVAINPAVRVTDANGTTVGNVIVTFAVTSGGGQVTGAQATTDANGVASVGSWVLGAGATNTLTATVAANGVAGNPVTFTASSATQIAITTQPPANTTSGTNFNVVVQLHDAANANSPVTGAFLTISLASGAGNLNAGGTGLTVVTTAGVATFNVNLTGSGTRTLRISGAGLTSVVTTAVTIP